METNWLEKHLQALAGRTNSGAVERGGRMRFLEGKISARIQLRPAVFSYPVRTEMNVSDSDGTLILTWGWPTGGTTTTFKLAKKFKKPYLVIDLSKGGKAKTVEEWGEQNGIKVLNVAGPRESKAPGIHDKAVEFLREIFSKEKFLDILFL
jgi:hypothetical protein